MNGASITGYPSRSALRPRLLIIELDYHAEVLTSLCPMLAERFDLVLWTTDKIWQKTGMAPTLFTGLLVMPKKQPVASFWALHETALRAVDFVYFNTLEKHFAFFSRLEFRCPTVMRIHNTNASLFPHSSIAWSLRDARKVLSYLLWHVLLRQMWRHRERLYHKMSALMLPSDGVSARVAEAAQARGFTNICDYSMPFSCVGDAQPAALGDRVVFAVTGSVDARRKDYEVLFQALTELKRRRPDLCMEMVFLGWAKQERAQKVLDRFNALVDRQFQLTSFCDYVSEQTFTAHMARVHFLVAPMKLEARQKIHREFYGTTKISGLENDSLRYRKPVILPQDYALPDDLNRIAISYSDGNSLCDALIKMIDSAHWRTLTESFDELHNYKREAIAANFYELCQNLARTSAALPEPLPAFGGHL